MHIPSFADPRPDSSFVPNQETLHLLKECVPPEIRHQIFRMAFETDRPRELINVVSVDGKLDLQYRDQRRAKEHSAFECRKLWLQPHIVGQQLALEAAEAMYKSKFIFAVHADHLLDFLRQCPLSRLPNPGLLLCRLNLFMHEDKNFVGDGKSGQSLRLADWESIINDRRDRRQTRGMHAHTGYMRRCWRAISMMSRLTHLECRVMPAGGKQSAAQITSWEIRDMLPALWYFWKNGVSVRVYFRTWERMDDTAATLLPWPEAPIPDAEDPSTFEVSIDVGACLPFLDTYSPPPNEKDRLRAQRVFRLGFDRCLPALVPNAKSNAFVVTRSDIYTYHRVRFYDALAEFSKRLFPCSEFNLYTGDQCRAFTKPYSMDKSVPRVC